MNEKSAGACNLSESREVGTSEPTPADPSGRFDKDPSPTPRILDVAPRIRAFARRLCRSEHDAEEVAQDALARALRYQDSYDPRAGSLDDWMMKTAFRTYLDHRTRAARSPSSMGDAVDSIRSHEVHTAELRDEITNLLGTLTETERDVLLRFHRDRLSIREIAAALAMPEGTVKSHLHRARLRLIERGKQEK